MKIPRFLPALAVIIGAAAAPPSSLFAQDPGSSGPPAEAPNQAEFLAKLDAIPGYGGIAFGSDFSKAGDSMALEQDRGPLKIYKKKGESLLVGSALLETILYYFYEGKLYGVAFHTNDGQDSLALKSVFINALGMGEDSAEGGPSTIWIGKKVGALFDLNTSTGDGSAFLFDVKAHDAYLDYQSKAAQKAAAQLLKGQ